MAAASLTRRLDALDPFTQKAPQGAKDDDYGDFLDQSAIAGGGRSARQTDITKNKLRVSGALKMFLVDKGVLSPEDGGIDNSDPGFVSEALARLVQQSHIEVPSQCVDRSYPLPEYYISSSHNTYLTANQLTGGASATAYETALNAGLRCVEIDAWGNPENLNEPKVTHGYTLVSKVPFREICEKIRDVIDKEAENSTNADGYRAGPVFISLENHCNAQGQLRLVEIMKEVWGDRLLSKPVREKAHAEQRGEGEHVTLNELEAKIVVIVEYHLQALAKVDGGGSGADQSTNIAKYADSDSSDASDSSDDEEEKQAREDYKREARQSSAVDIIEELAELGVYAQSVKPLDNSWYELAKLTQGPHHVLINLSELGLASHLPINAAKISQHNSQHLMRVYPKGSRITSKNLLPVPCWAVGAQIAALNAQTFGKSLQLNEALFAGTDGYVLKPAPLRTGGDGNLKTGRRKKLRLHIGGATDIPVPQGREKPIAPYVSCLVYDACGTPEKPPKRKTAVYKQHKLGFLPGVDAGPPPTDAIWDEVLEWEFDDNELVFVRILIKSDDVFARNPHLACTSLRLLYNVEGWNFIRMLDLKGRETVCSLLVKFEVLDV